ncbi:MAG: hypothetical protein RQ751_05265 [Longimicrobiales bacterium]|nr:hypothetical protein [Longimicrobiales bacterium]
MAERGSRDRVYPLKFGGAAVFLVSATLLLVLVVLPQRYVLSSGFRESGVSFPVSRPPVPPVAVVQRSAPPAPTPVPALDSTVTRGPAEVFWDEVGPLLRSGRQAEALPYFEAYLRDHPEDRGVRREWAVTLLRAGRAEAGTAVLADLLAIEDDPELRLLLARTLRDLGRGEEASREYARLAGGPLDGASLRLEWGQALAWSGSRARAEEVLRAARRRHPGDPGIEVALARVLFAQGRSGEALEVIAALDEGALAAADGLALREALLAATAEPEPEPAPEPTPLQQAAIAREAGDPAEAARILRNALERDAEDLALRRALADVLQFELDDPEGALAELEEVERRSGYDPALDFRMAQLEIWTGATGQASVRLDRVLAHLRAGGSVPFDPPSEDDAPLTASRVLAVQGDLLRWAGDRPAAADRYREALATDPRESQAREGLAALDQEVADAVERAEAPRYGSTLFGLADTDDFRRLDVGGDWTGVEAEWFWRVQAGSRWLEGFDATGALVTENGAFGLLEGGRWWRWGTVRTALELGAETVRPGETDLVLGASARFLGLGAFTLDTRYRRGLAYDVTQTLQSVFAEVVQDHLRVTLSGSLDPVWSLWAETQVSWMDPRDVPGSEAGARLQADVALGRSVGGGVTVGWSAGVLGYTEAAPLLGARPAFWDPRLVAATGPFLRVDRPLGERWDLTGRVAPGVARLDERRGVGTEWVPHFTGEAGLQHRGDRIWSTLDLFLVQGRFDGYRAWGARLSVSLRDLPGLGGGR